VRGLAYIPLVLMSPTQLMFSFPTLIGLGDAGIRAYPGILPPAEFFGRDERVVGVQQFAKVHHRAS